MHVITNADGVLALDHIILRGRRWIVSSTDRKMVDGDVRCILRLAEHGNLSNRDKVDVLSTATFSVVGHGID
jgi:hypothetical protein